MKRAALLLKCRFHTESKIHITPFFSPFLFVKHRGFRRTEKTRSNNLSSCKANGRGGYARGKIKRREVKSYYAAGYIQTIWPIRGPVYSFGKECLATSKYVNFTINTQKQFRLEDARAA